MNAATIEATGGNAFRVSGELTFATARKVLRMSEANFAKLSSELAIDLSAVSVVDSAGLALLIEWYRQATQCGHPVRFLGAPAQLKALAKISDVDKLLAID